MDQRDDSNAKVVEDVFGRIADALRDTEAALPATTRAPQRQRRSFSELAPHIAPYQIPVLVIGTEVPPPKPSSRRVVDRSRDHAVYAAPHAPRSSIPPVGDFSTRRIVRSGATRSSAGAASTLSFFALVALAVVAMSAAALAYVKPETKPGAAHAAIASPVLQSPPMLPTVVPQAAPTPVLVPSMVPTVVATRAVPGPTKPRGSRGAKSGRASR